MECNEVLDAEKDEQYEWKLISFGSYSRVFRLIHLKTKEILVAKVLNLKDHSISQKKSGEYENTTSIPTINREIFNLNALQDVPGVVKFRGWHKINFQEKNIIIDPKYPPIALVFEYIDGLNLIQWHELARKSYQFCPNFFQMVKKISFALCKIIADIHDKDYTHHDIKAENVMIKRIIRHEQSLNNKFQRLNGDVELKLLDFGFSQKGEDQFIGNGSAPYISPEKYVNHMDKTKKDSYKGSKVDAYAMGIVIFSLLCGSFPFKDNEKKEYFLKHNKFPSIDFNQYKESFSVESIDLLEKLLDYDPEKRITPKQALDHKWFK